MFLCNWRGSAPPPPHPPTHSRTSAECIHSRGTGHHASVQAYSLSKSTYKSQQIPIYMQNGVIIKMNPIPTPQQNVSIAAVRGTMHPSKPIAYPNLPMKVSKFQLYAKWRDNQNEIYMFLCNWRGNFKGILYWYLNCHLTEKAIPEIVTAYTGDIILTQTID